MHLKIGWGKRIAILYLGFVGIIVTLIIGSTHQHFDLVSKDYYARELAFQNTIDASRNTAMLSAPLKIAKSDNDISIIFPEEFAGKTVKTDIDFYSPVNAAFDKKITTMAEEGKVSFLRSELKGRRYQVKVSWSVNGKHYYQQLDLDLNS